MRLLGVCEVVVGVWVLVAGASLASACMAVLYATFAGFDEHQRRRGVECSCFGASAAPATAGHVAMNVAAGIAATVSPATSLATTIGEDGAVGLMSVLLLATATAP